MNTKFHFFKNRSLGDFAGRLFLGEAVNGLAMVMINEQSPSLPCGYCERALYILAIVSCWNGNPRRHSLISFLCLEGERPFEHTTTLD